MLNLSIEVKVRMSASELFYLKFTFLKSLTFGVYLQTEKCGTQTSPNVGTGLGLKTVRFGLSRHVGDWNRQFSNSDTT